MINMNSKSYKDKIYVTRVEESSQNTVEPEK